MSEFGIGGRMRAWCQLIRLPNLLTVPGDQLAGFFMAQMGVQRLEFVRVLPSIGSALLLYMAGLVWNDYADYDEDGQNRPERPLPSGRVSRRTAGIMATVLAALGLGVATLGGEAVVLTAAVLLGLILFYDFVTKRIPLLGPLNMGLCRGCSVWLGACSAGMSAFTSVVVVIAAMGVTLYVSAVTSIAVGETERRGIGFKRWMPLICLSACFAALFVYTGCILIPVIVLAIFVLVWTWVWGHRLRGFPEGRVVSAGIGGFIKGLLGVQAVFLALASGQVLWVAVGILIIWLISTVLATRFYVT